MGREPIAHFGSAPKQCRRGANSHQSPAFVESWRFRDLCTNFRFIFHSRHAFWKIEDLVFRLPLSAQNHISFAARSANFADGVYFDKN